MSLAVGIGRTYYVDNPLQQNIQLGIGYNTLTGQTTAMAVTDQTPVPPSGGQNAHYTLKVCETTDEFDAVLEISASASYAGVINSGSARLDFARTLSENRYSLYVVVRCTVTNAVSFVTNPQPSGQMAEMIGAGGPKDFEAFRNKFGDSYVKSAQTGGEFIGVLRWQTTTRQEQTKIRAEIDGQLTSTNFNASTQAQITNLHTSSNYEVSIYRNGAQNDLPSADDMIKKALSFPTDVNAITGHPVVYQFGTAEYDVVLPTASFPSVTNRSARLQEYAGYLKRFNIVSTDIKRLLFFQSNRVNWDKSVAAARERIKAAVTAIQTSPYKTPDDPSPIDSAVTSTLEALEYNLTQPIVKTDIVPPGMGDAWGEVPKYIDTWVQSVTFYIDGDKMRGITWQSSDGTSFTHGDTRMYPYTWEFQSNWVLRWCSIFWTGYGHNTPKGISLYMETPPGSSGWKNPVPGGTEYPLNVQVAGRRLVGFCGARNPDDFIQCLGLYTAVVHKNPPL